jgi:hypothetical protein
MKKIVTKAVLHAGPLDVSDDCFVKFSGRYKRCAAVKGYYFTGI